jgi:hypothetical protein
MPWFVKISIRIVKGSHFKTETGSSKAVSDLVITSVLRSSTSEPAA